MCLKITPIYEKCGHSGVEQVDLILWDDCILKKREECPNLRPITEKHPQGECWRCLGDAKELSATAEPAFYKHAFISIICEHEFNHMVTDVEREPEEEDVVLLTPDHELCPDCQLLYTPEIPASVKPVKGSIALQVPRSRMPPEFENLTRRTLAPGVGEVPRSNISSQVSLSSKLVSKSVSVASMISRKDFQQYLPSQAPRRSITQQPRSIAPRSRLDQQPISRNQPPTSRMRSQRPPTTSQNPPTPSQTPAPQPSQPTINKGPVSKAPLLEADLPSTQPYQEEETGQWFWPDADGDIAMSWDEQMAGWRLWSEGLNDWITPPVGHPLLEALASGGIVGGGSALGGLEKTLVGDGGGGSQRRG